MQETSIFRFDGTIKVLLKANRLKSSLAEKLNAMDATAYRAQSPTPFTMSLCMTFEWNSYFYVYTELTQTIGGQLF